MRAVKVAALVCSLSCQGPGAAGARSNFTGDSLDRSFDLGPTPEVRVGSVNGPITTSAGKGSKVVLSAVKEGGDAAERARVGVELSVGADRLGVRTLCPRLRGCGPVRVRYHLQVPQGTRLLCHSVNGAVQVRGVKGQVEARTVDGTISTEQTGNAALQVSTVSGRIRVRRPGGSLRASVVSGAVELDLEKITHEVTVRSVSGPIRLRVDPGAGAQVSFSTVSGRLESDLPLQGEQGGRRNRQGRLGAGGPGLGLSTVSGDVQIGRL